jgi:L-lysine exporter family protein LysE/ArgO
MSNIAFSYTAITQTIATSNCTSPHRYLEHDPMWQSYLNGLLVAFGLIMAIGTQNAYVLAQSLRREHHVSVALLCIVCDAILVTAGVFGLANVLAHNPTLLAVARWGGVVFLLWYGSKALRRAVSPQSLQQGDTDGQRSRRAVLLTALAVTLLNPHVYLDTVLLIGSLGAQQTEPGAYVAGAASASLLWFSTLAIGAAWLAPWLARPATWRLLDLMVAAMMFSVAVQLIRTA